MRQLRLPFYLTFQYIRRGRKWTLILTILLMTIAFVNLIFIPSFFNGIIDGSNKQIINTMTGDIYLAPKTGEDYISNANSVMNEIQKIEGVKSTSARIVVPARLKYKNITGGWQISAVNPADFSLVANISKKISSGEYLKNDDLDGIIIGRQIAGGSDVEENAMSFKGAKVGEKVSLIFDGSVKEFTIRGIFNTNFVESDKRAFISEAALNSIVPKTQNSASTINIRVSDNVDQSKITEKIKDLKLGVNVYSWQEATGIMKSVSGSFLSINILLSFTSILIAAVTILIIIYVTIINKRKEIGILRAIGIRPYIIVLSYVILSAVYATIGVMIGTLAFWSFLVPYFNAHPFSLPICDAVLVMNWSDFAIRLEAILMVSIFAGLIPAIIVCRAKMLNAILGR